jgi:dihydropteroate synthase
MGILNVTPDSFYASSRIALKGDQVLDKAKEMTQEGADILDVGGYSTRPNAEEVSEEEEINRVLPAIQMIKARFPDILVSIDTFRSTVAANAVREGADIVNDISGGTLDESMLATVGRLDVPYIAMHMRGTPKDMQTQTHYEDILAEMLQYFGEKLSACKKAGIKDVIIDPGFGFAKTLEQNYWILKNLSYFKIIQSPILAGVSRKSMIYKILELNPEDALNGTTALHMAALINGANILRVHDVKEAVQTITLYKQLYP